MQRSVLILETWKQKLKTAMVRVSVGVGVSVSVTALAMKALHRTAYVHSLMPRVKTHMLWARFFIDNSDMNCGQSIAMAWKEYLKMLRFYAINSTHEGSCTRNMYCTYSPVF